MGKKKPLSDDMRKLRARAEKRVTPDGKQDIARMSTDDIVHLIHELDTHQIELEMQNEDLRRVQEELMEASERLTDLYDFAPVGYITLSEKGFILQSNLTFTEMLGVPKTRLINQPLSAHIVEEDQNVYYKHKRMLLETRKKQRCELRLKTQRTDPFWVLLDSVPVESPEESKGNRIRSTLSDITERVKAEEALHKSRDELEMRVQEQTAELKQANRVTQGINEISQEALTCKTEKQLGRTCLAVAEKLTNSEFGVLVEFNSDGLGNATAISTPGWDARDTAVADVELCVKNMKIRGIDLSTIWKGKSHIVNGNEMAAHPNRRSVPEGHSEITTFLGVPLRREGKTIGFVGLGNKRGGYELKDQEAIETLSAEIVEVMTGKRAEMSLRNACQELDRKERLAVLGQLSGGVGHELRNPMGVISNAAYYLNTILADADETTREYLGIISSEIRNADKIISDLLDLSRTGPAERREIAGSALVDQALRKQPTPQHVEVSIEVPADLPPVFVDPGQIVQVLVNLIRNACQAMPEGGKLIIAADELTADDSIQNQKSKIRIQVSDTGCGISEDTMTKLYEPLFTTKPRGIGLGLSVSRNLVKANSGTIEVVSEVGKGSTFTITLPTNKA